MDKIKRYIGNHYMFRVDGIIMSGCFCGIGAVNDNYGMVFILTECGKFNKARISSCLFVHPSRLKCMPNPDMQLYSDVLQLRKECRKFFKNNHLENNLVDIYYPSFEIKEICHATTNK